MNLIQNRKKAVILLGCMLLTGCVSINEPNLAPDSVAGRIITLDDRRAQICERPVGSEEWSAWTNFQYGCSFDFPFDANNQYRVAYNPSETTCMTYKKTGARSAEIRYESAESAHTCYLNFTTSTTGTATKEGYGEGSEYKQRNIKFRIK